MSSRMMAMQMPENRKGITVSRCRVKPPSVMLKLEKLVKPYSRLEPLVSGPKPSYTTAARMISAKPRVAMAR